MTADQDFYNNAPDRYTRGAYQIVPAMPKSDATLPYTVNIVQSAPSPLPGTDLPLYYAMAPIGSITDHPDVLPDYLVREILTYDSGIGTPRREGRYYAPPEASIVDQSDTLRRR